MRLSLHYKWVIVFASLLCFFVFGFFESYGVFFKPLIEEFGWSRALTSSVFSVYAVSNSISGIIMGRLCDDYGPRRVVMLGGFLLGLGIFLSSQITTIGYLYIFWGIASFGSGALAVPPLAMVVRWFKEKRGLALGITNSGYGISLITMAPIATILISIYGWRTTFTVIGLFFLALIIAVAFLMRSNPKSTAEKVHEKVKNANLSLRETIFSKPFIIIYIIYFVEMVCFTSILVHIVPLALDLGISSISAALALGLIGASSIFGNTIVGAISDKTSRLKMLTICLLAMAAILFWLIWAKNIWMIYTFAIIFGFSGSGVWTLMPLLVEEFFGMEKVGVNLGVMTTTFGVGGITGPILFGYIFDISSSYQIGITICLLFTITAIILSHSLKIFHPAKAVRKKNT